MSAWSASMLASLTRGVALHHPGDVVRVRHCDQSHLGAGGAIGGDVFRAHAEHAVGIERKADRDLRLAARCWVESAQFYLTEQGILSEFAGFSLTDAHTHDALAIDRRDEHARALTEDLDVAFDHWVAETVNRFHRQREQSHVDQKRRRRSRRGARSR